MADKTAIKPKSRCSTQPEGGRMWLLKSLFALLTVLGLGACVGAFTPNTSNPDRFSLAPSAVAHLRAPQTIKFNNAYLSAAIFQLRFPRSGVTVDQDQQQYTETAIVMLSRAMEKEGISRSSDAKKTITLRVRIVDYRLGGVVISPEYHGRVALDAEFGDGSVASISGSGMSSLGHSRAFDAAILVALNRLVADKKFVAYINN